MVQHLDDRLDICRSYVVVAVDKSSVVELVAVDFAVADIDELQVAADDVVDTGEPQIADVDIEAEQIADACTFDFHLGFSSGFGSCCCFRLCSFLDLNLDFP